jgi:hypothetical protein
MTIVRELAHTAQVSHQEELSSLLTVEEADGLIPCRAAARHRGSLCGLAASRRAWPRSTRAPGARCPT